MMVTKGSVLRCSFPMRDAASSCVVLSWRVMVLRASGCCKIALAPLVSSHLLLEVGKVAISVLHMLYRCLLFSSVLAAATSGAHP